MDVHYYDTMLVLYEDIYGILAAPPCTEFSLAKGNKPRDFTKAMRVVEACLKIIWRCREHNEKLKFWAMENPRGFLRQFLGIPHFSFEQWQFEDDGIKPTDIWGYFNKPTPPTTDKPTGLAKTNPNGRRNGRGMSVPKCPPEYKHLSLNRAAIRAITPPGFAQSFFKANR